MANWTLAQIRSKVERDLATEDELFVQPKEWIDYINEAIREAEAEITKLGLDDEYFLTKTTMSIVQGQAEYSLPPDIFANKINRVIYENGAVRYPIKRLRGSKAIEHFHELNYLPTGTDYYRYLITNDGVSGVKMQIAPTPQVSETNTITVWYHRDAKQLSVDTDACDIPEFVNFVLQYVKCRIYEKDVGHPNAQMAAAQLEKQRALMVETLTDMVEDGDNVMEQDTSFYQECV